MWTIHLCTISYVANHVHKITENSGEIKTNVGITNQTPLQRPQSKVLLKVDTGSNINCISLGTFHKLFPNKQLNRSMLLLENYGNLPVTITGKFTSFIRWKEKVFHHEFHVTNANSTPNLLSRDACFRIEVFQACFVVTGKELPQPEPVSNQSINPHKKRKKVCILLIKDM